MCAKFLHDRPRMLTRRLFAVGNLFVLVSVASCSYLTLISNYTSTIAVFMRQLEALGIIKLLDADAAKILTTAAIPQTVKIPFKTFCIRIVMRITAKI